MIALTLKIKSFCKEHFWALAVATLAGLIMIAPQLIFIAQAPAYQGLYIMKTDAEVHYLARMKEFVDNGNVGNPYFFEYRNVVSPVDTISEAWLALPALLIPVTVPQLNLFYKFLLPALIFILVYLLFLKLVPKKGWSISVAVAVVLGNYLTSAGDILNSLGLNTVYHQFLLYSRPVNPEFSSIVFFLYLNIFVVAMRKDSWKYFFTLGAILGLSFYVYLYSFTFLLALNFVFGMIFLFRKRIELFGKIFLATAVGLILGSVQILRFYQILLDPNYQSLAKVGGVENYQGFIISTAGLFVSVLFLVYLFWNRKNIFPDTIHFVTGLLITSWIVINQQVLTGLVLQSGHYHWYYNTPIYIITLFWIIYYFVSDKVSSKNIVTFGLVLISTLSIGHAVFVQYSSYTNWKGEYTADQRIMPALTWLEKNTGPESVTLANTKISELIPIYTRGKVAYSLYGTFYLIPEARRLLTTEKILSDLNSFREKYRLDYVLWDQKAEAEWGLDKNQSLKLLWNNNDIAIYGFK